MRFEITYKYKGSSITTSKNDNNVSLMVDELDRRVIAKVKALEKITVEKVYLSFGFEFRENDSIFCNGYQSCTDSKEFSIDEKMNNLKQVPSLVSKKFGFKSYGDIAFYEYEKDVLHSWDVGYVRGDENKFIGNNNYQFAGIIIEFRHKEGAIRILDDINNVVMEKDETVLFFDFNYEDFTDLNELEYFKQFTPRTTKKLVGYSSWYNHFDNINEGILIDNLNAVDKEVFNLFQIDDGYEAAVGDWKLLNQTKFPKGLRTVVEKIHEKNLLAGIWLAPFVAQEGSKLIEYHPNWLKLVDGKPVKCGSNWGGFYALDFYNDEVRKYIKDCLLFFKDMGFEFFKLDFLYAVSLPLYEGKNRHQVACEAYRFLREVLGDSIILGNSCIMAPAFGVFDYVRIGPSITSEFDDSWVMRKMHRERNSTKVAIQNTIYRSIFNGKVFMNDPDVFLLRKELKMTFEQKYSLAMINAIFGSILMTSDDITTYAALYQSYDKKAAKLLEKIIYLTNNVKNAKYVKVGNKINISYELDNVSYSLEYDPEEGVSKEL